MSDCGPGDQGTKLDMAVHGKLPSQNEDASFAAQFRTTELSIVLCKMHPKTNPTITPKVELELDDEETENLLMTAKKKGVEQSFYSKLKPGKQKLPLLSYFVFLDIVGNLNDNIVGWWSCGTFWVFSGFVLLQAQLSFQGGVSLVEKW